MKCQFHDIPKGTIVSSDEWRCSYCYHNVFEYRQGTYVGDESPTTHLVSLFAPIICDNCEHVCYNAKFNCNSSGVWKIEAIPVEIPVKLSSNT